MNSKLELDFHYWRFWTFTLLVVVVSTAIAYFSLKAIGSDDANTIGIAMILFVFLYLIAQLMFQRRYFQLRSKLE